MPIRIALVVAMMSLAAASIGCSSSEVDEGAQAKDLTRGFEALQPVPDGAEEPGPPRSAEAFVDSIGVNVHLSYTDTAYADFDLVSQRLRELGIRHVRDNLVPDDPQEYERLNALAAIGIGSTLIMGNPDNGIEGLEELLAIAADQLPGAVDALEGPNELDISEYADWPEQLVEYQTALYEKAGANARLASTPVVGPSLAWIRHVREAPNLTSFLDYGNIHSYSGGEPPETLLGEWLRGARYMSGNKPVFATETGYHTAVDSDEDHPPASESAQAAYVPRLFLEYFANDVVRTFTYELLDEHPDPDLDTPESDFGLLRNDFSPKPAFIALRNLIEILSDPGGEAFVPAALPYTLSGNTADLRQTLLGKQDGSHWVALWRAGSVWNPDTHETIQPGSAPITLQLDDPPRTVTEYQPNVSGRPTATLPVRAGAVRVRVGTRVVIVEVESP